MKKKNDLADVLKITFDDLIQRQIPNSIKEAKIWGKSFRGGLILTCFAFVVALPLAVQNNYLFTIFINAMVFSIYAASWDLLAGITGQVSFGHAVFLGIGGYACAAFTKLLGVHWFVSILMGAIFAVIAGLIIGIPSLRLKGPYLALGSLSFGLVIFDLFNMGSLAPYLGGTGGISQIPNFAPDKSVQYIIVIVFMVVSIVSMLAITNSKLGTIFKGIRDDEIAVEAIGINKTKYKIIAFMISGFFAGIAGSLFTLVNRAVNPAYFSSIYSFYAIVMAAIGGIGTISGSVFGAFFYVLVSEMLRFADEWALLVFAIILILVVRFAEFGMMKPVIKRFKEFIDVLLGK